MTSPFDPLIRLNSTVYLHRPSSYNELSPTFILATWMNAAMRNIMFYVNNIRRISPSAQIFVLRGYMSNMIYRSETTQKRELDPVIRRISDGDGRGGTFLYAFSNSGAQQSALLLRAYKDARGGKLLPLKGLILDSTPSRGSFPSAYTGMAYQIKTLPWYIKLPGLGLLVLLIIGVGLVGKLRGKSNVLSRSNTDLNDESLVRKDSVRQYMYSKEDKLVTWQDVEWHAAVAKSLGWKAGMELFQGSEHCRHAKGLGELRYWEIIGEIVDTRIQGPSG